MRLFLSALAIVFFALAAICGFGFHTPVSIANAVGLDSLGLAALVVAAHFSI